VYLKEKVICFYKSFDMRTVVSHLAADIHIMLLWQKLVIEVKAKSTLFFMCRNLQIPLLHVIILASSLSLY